MDIKKKYNHFSIESELLKNNYFQKFFDGKKGTKRDTVLTQLPITISKETSLAAIEGIINESIITNYQTMKGVKIKLLPIFDTEHKNLKTKNYENILTKAGVFFGIDTDNVMYSERNTNFVRNLFVELVNEGYIYEDCSINYWSINEQKTLGTDELQRKKMKTKQYNLRYFVDTKNISLIIPTLWPETIFADVALAVHPDDKRYKKLIGNKVIIPIINKTIPIIGDDSVNISQGTGIMRITPAHDENSLIIAQKNELKIDKFAIDKNGYFTKHAGDFCKKEAKEFVKNIINNLDDIHNLESTSYIETNIAIHRKTGEKALPLLCKQLFIKIDKELENIQSAIQEKKINIIPDTYKENIENIIQNIEYWPVTKEDSKGYSLPLWKSKNGKSYFISDNEFLNLPAKKTKNKFIVLSLIIFNLIIDGRLKQHFSIEECIDVLLSSNLTGEKTTLETYIELFEETLPRGHSKELQNLKKIVEYSEKDFGSKKPKSSTKKGINNFEKFSAVLTEFLDKSIIMSSKKKGFYTLEMDMLTNNDEGLQQQKEKIEETLGHAFILVKIMEAFNDKKHQPKKTFSINEQNIFEFLKTIIIGYSVQDKILFDDCIIQKKTTTNKREKETLKELIKQYGTDCTRMYAIDKNQEIIEHNQFINKLWNASRFIAQQTQTKKQSKPYDFNQISKYVIKKYSQISEFESRIIYKITEFQKEYEELMTKNALQEIQQKMTHIIKEEFCDKYLEIQKHNDTEHGEKVTLRCLGNILKLSHPFIPFVSQYLRKVLGFEGYILSHQLTEDFPSIQKNYKTQLFMDIINKFLEMKKQHNYAKHEEVEVCFFAPLDFLQYLRKQEKILYKLIKISSIEYLENEKKLEKYHTESIINITIGIKIERKEIINNKKENLKNILKTKEEELQSIRILIPSLSASGTDPDIIRQKKRDMNKLKKDIEEIQYQIQKERAK